MKNHKGEIATFLTLSLVVVGTVLTIATSILTNTKKNIASNPRAKMTGETPTLTRIQTTTRTPMLTKTPQETYNCSEHGGGTAYEGIGCYDVCSKSGLIYIPNSQGKGSDNKNYCCCKQTEASQEFDTCYKAYRKGMYGCRPNENKVVIYAYSMSAVGMTNCSNHNKESTTALYFAQRPDAYKDGGCYVGVWDGRMNLNEKNQQAKQLLSPTLQPGTEGGRCIIEYNGMQGSDINLQYYCSSDLVCSNQTGDGICVKPSSTPTPTLTPEPSPPISPSEVTGAPTPAGNGGGNSGNNNPAGQKGNENQPCISIQAAGKPTFYYCLNNLICSNQDTNGICVKSIISRSTPTPKVIKFLGFFVMSNGNIFVVNNRDETITNIRAIVRSDSSIKKGVDLGSLNKDDIGGFEYICTRSFLNMISVVVTYTYKNNNYSQSIKGKCGYDYIVILN